MKRNKNKLTLCISLGVIYGILFDNLAIGLSLGTLFGIVIERRVK